MASSMPNDPRDDELESVAESLLGIDFSASEIPDAIELDDDDLFADEPEAAAESVVEADEAPAPTAAQSAPVASKDEISDEELDFGFDVDLDDEDDAGEPEADDDLLETVDISFGAEEDEFEDTEESFDAEADDSRSDVTSAGEKEAEEEEEEEEPAPSAKVRPKDEFWDALEGWDWDEEGKDSRDKPASRGRGQRREEPSRTPPSRSSRPAPPRREELSDDDAFGAELQEESAPPVRESREERRGPSREERPQRGEERDSGRRRGRRGGRSERDDRPREDDRPVREERGSREERPAAREERPARAERPAREERSSREEQPPRRQGRDPEPVGFDDDDEGGFGAGLEIEPSESGREVREESGATGEERRGRRRGRGRGRGRGRDASGERESTPRPAAESRPTAERVDEPEDDFGFEDDLPAAESVDSTDADSSDDVESEVRFKDVPTWEEAISYLARPKVKAGSSGSSTGGGGGGGEGSRRSGSGDGDRSRRRGGGVGGGGGAAAEWRAWWEDGGGVKPRRSWRSLGAYSDLQAAVELGAEFVPLRVLAFVAVALDEFAGPFVHAAQPLREDEDEVGGDAVGGRGVFGAKLLVAFAGEAAGGDVGERPDGRRVGRDLEERHFAEDGARLQDGEPVGFRPVAGFDDFTASRFDHPQAGVGESFGEDLGAGGEVFGLHQPVDGVEFLRGHAVEEHAALELRHGRRV